MRLLTHGLVAPRLTGGGATESGCRSLFVDAETGDKTGGQVK